MAAECRTPQTRAAPKERAAAGAQPDDGHIHEATTEMNGHDRRVVKSDTDRQRFLFRLCRSDLLAGEMRMAIALSVRWRKGEPLRPIYDDLAADAAVSRRSAMRQVAALVEADFVAIKRSGGGSANTFFLLLNGDTQHVTV
jgi:hypothetical protein